MIKINLISLNIKRLLIHILDALRQRLNVTITY